MTHEHTYHMFPVTNPRHDYFFRCFNCDRLMGRIRWSLLLEVIVS